MRGRSEYPEVEGQATGAVVAAAAAGDRAAFETLVRSYQGRVWRYVLHIVSDRELAEDVTQDTFVRVHRKLHTLQDPDRFAAWLLTTARHAAFDLLRKRRRRPLTLAPADAIERTAASVDPHLESDVADAVAALDPPLREALVLVGILGFTYDEAGQSLGIPAGTVKSRVFRARTLLIDVLRPSQGADRAM